MKSDAKRTAPCPNCGAAGAENWSRVDKLPQIGTVYECSECGQLAYLYDTSQPPTRGESVVWAPVTQHMRVSLQFFEIVDEWPDTALTDLFKHGLERMQAIDYHIVEREGLSQSEWARLTGRNQSTVSGTIREAKARLADSMR